MNEPAHKRRKERKQIELTIDSISQDGFGLASGPPEVEVPFTLPGDQVLATPLRRRRGRVTARLETVSVPSGDRVQPRCCHFGVCGGCRWQHIPYSTQLAWKQDHVEKAFGELITSETKVFPALACDPPWSYRNKMEFSFSSDAKGERYLGLVMQGGRGHVFHLTECHLVDHWMVETVAITRQWWTDFGLEAYHPYRDTGSLRTLTLRQGLRSGERLVMLTVSGNADYAIQQKALDALKARLRETTQGVLSLFLRIQQIRKGSPTQFYELLLHGPDCIREQLHIQALSEAPKRIFTFKIGPTAFFQPNTLLAEKLYSRALQMSCLSSQDTIYDLCCGTGTIGISASPYVQRVIGVELSPEAVLDARANAAENGCTNLVVHAGDVGQVLERLKASGEAPPADTVIVDPPRAGLGSAAIQQILGLTPKQVLYISCNPRTQASDAQQLCALGYRLMALQPVDQFPQTVHIENIALFTTSLKS